MQDNIETMSSIVDDFITNSPIARMSHECMYRTNVNSMVPALVNLWYWRRILYQYNKANIDTDRCAYTVFF